MLIEPHRARTHCELRPEGSCDAEKMYVSRRKIETNIQKIESFPAGPREQRSRARRAGTAAAIRPGVALRRPSKRSRHGTVQASLQTARLQELRLHPRRRRRRRPRLHRGLRQPARPPVSRRRRAGRLRAAAGASPAGAGGRARRGRRAHQPPHRRRQRGPLGADVDGAARPRAAALRPSRPGLPPAGERHRGGGGALPVARGAVGRRGGHGPLRARSGPRRRGGQAACPPTWAPI